MSEEGAVAIAEAPVSEAASESAPVESSEPSDGGAELQSEAANDNATQEQPPKPERHRVKVDGEELEVDTEELKKSYERAKASYKRFEESARDKKQAQAVLEALKNPGGFRQVARAMGLDERSLAEEILTEHLRLEAMTPEQRRIQELEEQAAAYSSKEKEREEAANAERLAHEEREAVAFYEQSFKGALGSAGLPVTQHSMLRMAAVTEAALREGIDLDPAEAAAIVREEFAPEVKSYLGALTVDDLLSLIGDERMAEVRKRNIEKIQPPSLKRAAPVAHQPADEEAQVLRIEDFFESLKGR